MNRELARGVIEASYELLEEEPTDRLDYLKKALQIKQVILRCMIFLDDVKGSPYLEVYTKEDFVTIHEAFCDSAEPLLLMLEYFLEKAMEEVESAADSNPFAV